MIEIGIGDSKVSNRKKPKLELDILILYNKETGELHGPYWDKDFAISQELELERLGKPGFRARRATLTIEVNKGRIH